MFHSFLSKVEKNALIKITNILLKDFTSNEISYVF